MSPLRHLPFILILLLVAFSLTPNFGQTKVMPFLSVAEVTPLLQSSEENLPLELKGLSNAQRATVWPHWAIRHDTEIRTRLRQGDEDSLVNLLLFGTSFTTQPRITSQQLERSNQDQSSVADIMQQRLNDFLKALQQPGTNERLLFARDILVTQPDLQLETEVGRQQVRVRLLSALGRVLQEAASYTQILQRAQLLKDANEVFRVRSQLYQGRGLSSDTSLLPNFALEMALTELRDKGILPAKKVLRVAIVGPGLDFTDKQEGYDFYPQQTIQPFAVIDTLLRLGLAQSKNLQIATLDLSPRINKHIAGLQEKARQGRSYTLQLPRDDQAGWRPELVNYWEHFGDHIGIPAKPMPLPVTLSGMKLRAVRVRPAIATKVTPVDLNIVLQHLTLPSVEKFDLIIGTNIFVYYDTFEQSLTMLNISQMLRPGGILLSNNALLELPVTPMRSIGYTSVAYSGRANDGDFIIWYQNTTEQQ